MRYPCQAKPIGQEKRKSQDISVFKKKRRKTKFILINVNLRCKKLEKSREPEQNNQVFILGETNHKRVTSLKINMALRQVLFLGGKEEVVLGLFCKLKKRSYFKSSKASKLFLMKRKSNLVPKKTFLIQNNQLFPSNN